MAIRVYSSCEIELQRSVVEGPQAFRMRAGGLYRINRNELSSRIEEVEQIMLGEVIERPHIYHIDVLDLLQYWGLLFEL